jgi:uncharacterized protein associated with vWA-MoxR-VMAP ternary system
MAKRRKSKGQSGGVQISGGKVRVGGDIVGRDKITTARAGMSGEELNALVRAFQEIREQIDARPKDPNVDRSELVQTVERIEKEVVKGTRANPTKVERWLRTLAAMAEDIFEVVVAALSHPVAGVSRAVQLIAKKAREEARQ